MTELTFPDPGIPANPTKYRCGRPFGTLQQTWADRSSSSCASARGSAATCFRSSGPGCEQSRRRMAVIARWALLLGYAGSRGPVICCASSLAPPCVALRCRLCCPDVDGVLSAGAMRPPLAAAGAFLAPATVDSRPSVLLLRYCIPPSIQRCPRTGALPPPNPRPRRTAAASRSLRSTTTTS